MTNWNLYTALTTPPVLADTLLILDTTATPPSAGQVKQVTVPLLGQALAVILYPSGDTTGATDKTAIAAVLTAASGAPVVIRLSPTAPWFISCGTLSLTTAQYIDATGCLINAKGAGDLFRWVDTSTYSARTKQGGGLLGFPVIDGSTTTGNSAAVHAGDILQLAVFAQAQNFTAGTTSKGVWLDNQNFWTEQLYGRVYAQNCTAGVVFDVSGTPATTATGSYDRADLDVYVNQSVASQDGVVFQNGSYIDDIANLHIGGNFQTSSTTPTSALLRITGVAGGTRPDAGVNSHLGNGRLSINAECGIVTGTAGPFTIFFGSGSNYISNPIGSMSFDADGPNFQFSNSAGSSQFVFTGPVTGDNNLVGTYVGALTTSLITMFGSSGSLGPSTVAADGNNLPFITNPNGLFGYIQQSQAAATSAVGPITAVTITSIGSLSVPANDPVAGARYRVTAHGRFGTATTAPTATVGLRWGGTGGTLIAAAVTNTNGAPLSASITAGAVVIEGEVEFITATTCVGWVRLSWSGSTTSGIALASVTTAVTVTVSSAQALTLAWTWGTAASGTTITIASSSFERVS